LAEGGSLFGVAEIKGLPEQHCSLSPKTREGLDRAISIGFHLSDRVLEDIEGGPTKLYFFHYQRVNLLLDELGLKMTNYIFSPGDGKHFQFQPRRLLIGKNNAPTCPISM